MKNSKSNENSSLIPSKDLISDYIKNLGTEDINLYSQTAYKLQTGFVIMSRLYSRFISVMLPMLKSIEDHKKDEDYSNLTRLRFSLIIKNYTRVYSPELESNANIYDCLNNTYMLNIDKSISSEDYIMLTLKPINNSYRDLLNEITLLSLEPSIEFFSLHYDNLEKILKKLYLEIMSFEEDLKIVFLNYSAFGIFNSEEISKKYASVSIKSLKDLSNEVKDSLAYLDDTYLILNEIVYALGYAINFKDPENIGEAIDSLYDDLYKAFTISGPTNDTVNNLFKQMNKNIFHKKLDNMEENNDDPFSN